MSKNTAPMPIGAFARAAGVHVETVRFYQRRGLLPEPAKPLGGIRRYGAEEVGRVRFIKSAQALGFSLDEVKLLLELEDGVACTKARRIAEQKLGAVREKLADLKRIESALAKLVRRCGTGRENVCCPLIAALRGK